MNQILFETQNLSFNNIITYPDIKIPKNKVTFIRGKSGIGKSTLLKFFNKTLTQTSGDIFYCNKNINHLDSIELRKEISLISQGVFLFDDSIRNNFINFYNFRGEPVISDEEMQFFLKLCCIDFDLSRVCTTMSGGERQRIYMAIFLSFKPKVLMLDEPTSSLDSANSMQVITNVINYCKDTGVTVIIISHDNELIKNFSENTLLIERNCI